MDAFHSFLLFPFELRALIWQSTVQPRTVEVRVDHLSSYMNQHAHLVSSTPVPATLQVCREARNLGLYKRAFSDISADARYVWVNRGIDIISIGTSYFHYFDPYAPLIKRFQFERDNTDHFFYHVEARDLEAFLNVEETFLVCADRYMMESWYGVLEDHTFFRLCGGENVYLINLDDGGRIITATEWDAIMDQEYTEMWAKDGSVYPTGEPLPSSESRTQGNQLP
jgi:hypothetical protein